MQIKTIKLGNGKIKMVDQKTLDKVIEARIPYEVIDRKEV